MEAPVRAKAIGRMQQKLATIDARTDAAANRDAFLAWIAGSPDLLVGAVPD